MNGSDDFAIVTRDETGVESRLIHGLASRRGDTIEARDDCDEELLALCDGEWGRVRKALERVREGRWRSVVSASREGETVSTASTISINILDLSIVTTVPHLDSDYEMLIELASIPALADADPHELPVVWRNGSGAVLMHEAAGHAAEHGHAYAGWPSWLRVVDESERGAADLTSGEPPRAMRRQSFTDVPMRRMTSVRVDAGLAREIPARRIDVLLVAGGRYEPLTETVTVFVSAADLIDGYKSTRLRPFVIEAPRAGVARALRGAAGDIRRYPGVICSKEGQELFAGSQAPDLITDFR